MKTIRISNQTHKNILSCGNMGETFDVVMARIVDAYIADKEQRQK